MKGKAHTVALFGILTTLTLVLSLIDQRIGFLNNLFPGFKLGLANTVLIYAVYMMDWKSCVLLMLTKVLMTGLLSGSVQSIFVSLSGGVLSLAVMLLIRRKPEKGMIAVSALCAALSILIPILFPKLGGEMLWIFILTIIAFLASTAAFIATRKGMIRKVIGTSLCGAVAHNLGQCLIAAFVYLQTPKLMITYFPLLAAAGAIVGSLTGITAERVMKALKLNPETGGKEAES